jgi:hypothetical protein
MKLMSPREAAAYLALSAATLAKWRFLGGGPAYLKYSQRCVRYRQDVLDAWLAARTTQHTAQSQLRLVA